MISLCQLVFLLITWPVGLVLSYPTRFLPFSSCCSLPCPLAPAMDMPCFLLFGQLLRKSQVANLGNYCMMPWEPVGTLTIVLQMPSVVKLLFSLVLSRFQTQDKSGSCPECSETLARVQSEQQEGGLANPCLCQTVIISQECPHWLK